VQRSAVQSRTEGAQTLIAMQPCNEVFWVPNGDCAAARWQPASLRACQWYPKSKARKLSIDPHHATRSCPHRWDCGLDDSRVAFGGLLDDNYSLAHSRRPLADNERRLLNVARPRLCPLSLASPGCTSGMRFCTSTCAKLPSTSGEERGGKSNKNVLLQDHEGQRLFAACRHIAMSLSAIFALLSTPCGVSP